jgi:hypothetical protein
MKRLYSLAGGAGVFSESMPLYITCFFSLSLLGIYREKKVGYTVVDLFNHHPQHPPFFLLFFISP